MSISSGGVVKGQAETQEGRTFEGAAFSKTSAELDFSVVVGHGAARHRRKSDGGKRRDGWSG
jgi:hypothetical protein